MDFFSGLISPDFVPFCANFPDFAYILTNNTTFIPQKTLILQCRMNNLYNKQIK